jgi:hypothetical protein
MKHETTPVAFLNYALSYCESANILFEVNSTKEQNRLLQEPIYMLYFHATELALEPFALWNIILIYKSFYFA